MNLEAVLLAGDDRTENTVFIGEIWTSLQQLFCSFRLRFNSRSRLRQVKNELRTCRSIIREVIVAR